MSTLDDKLHESPKPENLPLSDDDAPVLVAEPEEAPTSPIAGGEPISSPESNNFPLDERPVIPVASASSQARATIPPTSEAPRPSTSARAGLETKPSDLGYVPRHLKRTLENGDWTYVEVADPEPKDVYDDINTFRDKDYCVQIVRFYMDEEKQTRWEKPLIFREADEEGEKHDDMVQKVKLSLESDGKAQLGTRRTWRWIACEGLNGDVLRTIARATGWPESLFAGVFSWTRASVELAGDRLLMHLIDQYTHLYILYAAEADCPTFITCSSPNPRKQLMDRLGRYIDRGDSRPELNPRKDPSLMFYNILRAVIQDLRASALQVRDSMDEAYARAMSRPSTDNVAFSYQLQQKLSRVQLDTVSLKPAASNLKIIAQNVKDKPAAPGRRRLISQETYERLADQLGLVELLIAELPAISHQADAVGELTFNMLAFNINIFLKFLAILAIVFAPLSVANGVFGSLNTGSRPVDRDTIVKTLASVGSASILLLLLVPSFSFELPWKKARAIDWDKQEAKDSDGDYATGYASVEQLEAEIAARKAHGRRTKAHSITPDEWTYLSQNSPDPGVRRSHSQRENGVAVAETSGGSRPSRTRWLSRIPTLRPVASLEEVRTGGQDETNTQPLS